MSEREELRRAAVESLADRLVNQPASWLPISGHVRNITFTLNEADLIASILRASITNVAQQPSDCGEPAAISERLANIMTWLREPDWTEQASLEWLMDWMNRRPIAELAMVAMLMPSPPSQSVPDCGASPVCPVNNPKWNLGRPCPVCGALGPWFENGDCVAPPSTESNEDEDIRELNEEIKRMRSALSSTDRPSPTRCRNCGDPTRDGMFCGMCREMGCGDNVPSTERRA